MKEIIAKASVLVEALPFFQAFHGKVFVIKLGGRPLANKKLKENVLRDLVALKYVGIKPVIVHGGGEEVSELSKKLGYQARFVDGLRVTDRETMDVVSMVLEGKVNGGIVDTLSALGVKAAGLSGRDSGMVRVRQASRKLGFVGKVESVKREIIDVLLDKDIIPVIAPLGSDGGGQSYNVNADIIAGEIAAALKASKLILMTDVPGLLRRKEAPDTLISTVRLGQMAGLKKRGIIAGGMIPKVDACALALRRGVSKAHILDARVQHAMLLEIFTPRGIGTEIVK